MFSAWGILGLKMILIFKSKIDPHALIVDGFECYWLVILVAVLIIPTAIIILVWRLVFVVIVVSIPLLQRGIKPGYGSCVWYTVRE